MAKFTWDMWNFDCDLDCFERLAQYEDAEERGLLVVLPCKVGDTVWDRFGTAWEITQVEHHMNGHIWFRCGHKGTDDYTAFADEYIGEDIFLTAQEGNSAKERWDKEVSEIHAKVAREEAEAALAKGAEHE